MADPINPVTPQESANLKPFTLPAAPTEQAIKTQFGGVPGIDMTKAPKSLGGVQQEEARVLQRQQQLGQDIGANELAQKQYQADVQASIATQERERTQAIEAKVDQVRKDFPYPELHPTKENIPELATLFSLIGVIGMAVGGAGKMSAIGSMNSMSGMMKGWQQGRADLWNREKQEFDKEMTKVKSIIDDAYKDADRAYKMMATDRREAEALANQSAAKMGGQIGKQILEKQGLEPYFKYLQEIKGDINKVLDRAVKTSKSVEGALPKDSKTRDEFRARYQAVKNVEDIQSLLDNPKYAKFINPTTGFTPAVLNNLRENFPELSSKLARIQAIEFQIGGKALTKNEQAILEPLYGWKGLTTDALKERLKEVKDNFNKTNGLVEIDYPGLKSLRGKYDQYYEQTGKVPEVPAPESAIYSVGDIVQKGEKRYKVTGVIKDGQGNIVDYDVDEVKAAEKSAGAKALSQRAKEISQRAQGKAEKLSDLTKENQRFVSESSRDIFYATTTDRSISAAETYVKGLERRGLATREETIEMLDKIRDVKAREVDKAKAVTALKGILPWVGAIGLGSAVTGYSLNKAIGGL